MGEYGDQSNTEEKPDDRDPDGIASDEKTPRVRGIQSYSRMQKLFTDPSPVWLTPNWHQSHSGSLWMSKAQSAFQQANSRMHRNEILHLFSFLGRYESKCSDSPSCGKTDSYSGMFSL